MNLTESSTRVLRKPFFHQASGQQKCVSIPQQHTINACLSTTFLSPRPVRQSSGRLLRHRVTFSAHPTRREFKDPTDVPVVYSAPRHGLCDVVEYSNGLGFVYNLSNIDSKMCWEICDPSLDLRLMSHLDANENYKSSLLSGSRTKRSSKSFISDKEEQSPRPHAVTSNTSNETNHAVSLKTVEKGRDIINIRAMPSSASSTLAADDTATTFLFMKNKQVLDKKDFLHSSSVNKEYDFDDRNVNKISNSMYIKEDYNAYQRRRQNRLKMEASRPTGIDGTFRLDNLRSSTQIKLNIRSSQVLRVDVA